MDCFVHCFFKPRIFVVWCYFRFAVFGFCGEAIVAVDSFIRVLVCLVLPADAGVEIFLQGRRSLLQFFLRHSGIGKFREFPEDTYGGVQKALSVVHALFDEPCIFPDEGDLVRVVKRFRVADIGDGDAQGAGHGVEFVIVPGEVLVRPGVGVSVAGDNEDMTPCCIKLENNHNFFC